MSSGFSPCELNSHPSALPGDPSLILVTNVDLGDKKLEVMKACSKAIQKATGKPEAYIGKEVSYDAYITFILLASNISDEFLDKMHKLMYKLLFIVLSPDQ